jgi:hypothetical protein
MATRSATPDVLVTNDADDLSLAENRRVQRGANVERSQVSFAQLLGHVGLSRARHGQHTPLLQRLQIQRHHRQRELGAGSVLVSARLVQRGAAEHRASVRDEPNAHPFDGQGLAAGLAGVLESSRQLAHVAYGDAR